MNITFGDLRPSKRRPNTKGDSAPGSQHFYGSTRSYLFFRKYGAVVVSVFRSVYTLGLRCS